MDTAHVYSFVLSTAFGSYTLHTFKTMSEALDRLQEYKDAYNKKGSVSIEKRDGVYNGSFKRQTAQEFHAA